jgi:hypothetical protein
MSSIHFTQTDFDFSTLTALTPVSSHGGSHLSKFRIRDSIPFYLQLPKCRTKQGIIKTSGGKKHYCDLVFTHENENFIRWMERLEEYSRKVLFDNRQKWFSTELNEHDIETLFVSPLKLYKSGKCYLLRVNVPTQAGVCSLKIYDENKDLVSTEEVKEDTQVITVIEIQGIKCSSMSFYLEIELKQMMVVTPVDQSFEHGCVIAREPATLEPVTTPSAETVTTPSALEPVSLEPATTPSAGSSGSSGRSALESVASPESVSTLGITTIDKNAVGSSQKNHARDQPANDLAEPSALAKPEPALAIAKSDPAITDIQEFDIDLEKTSSSEVFQIKKRNDLYYEMYREAKRKARIARDLAISTYLEAKRIKNTFLARDNTESDLDEEEFNLWEKA